LRQPEKRIFSKCVGQPLVNWITPNILRSEAERQAHAGEDIIVVNNSQALPGV